MIAIGIGANTKARKSDFAAALAEATGETGGADVLSTFNEAIFADDVRDTAREAGVAYCPVALETMRERNNDCSTRSERTLGLYGVASIAEAAALAGAGPGSRLIMPRRVLRNVTVAAARSADEREPSP